jgi:hypothetical protein
MLSPTKRRLAGRELERASCVSENVGELDKLIFDNPVDEFDRCF